MWLWCVNVGSSIIINVPLGGFIGNGRGYAHVVEGDIWEISITS